MNSIRVDRAVAEIALAADQCRQRAERLPFVFIVGAGISHPTIPLADEIVSFCRREVTERGVACESHPVFASAIEEYSYWFDQAYPHPADRQHFLRTLIGGKPVSPANLRLAHLLLVGDVSKIVLTPNFDDSLAKALRLFGSLDHRVCDHPESVERIDPELRVPQVVHVHGTYWFYDCCNLQNEIRGRAKGSTENVFTMPSLLDRVLAERAPLVLGYSGWEGDVIMGALKRRLHRRLPRRLYWFCYSTADARLLPEWLTSHPDVYLVTPPADECAGDPARDRAEDGLAAAAEARDETSLPAERVLEQLISSLGLESPEVTRNPLTFLADALEALLPPPGESGPDVDIYSLRSVVHRIRHAAQHENDNWTARGLERVREAVRRSRYEDALAAIDDLDRSALSEPDEAELVELMAVVAARLRRDGEWIGRDDTRAALAGVLPDCALALGDDVLKAEMLLDMADGMSAGPIPWDCSKFYDDVIKEFGDTESEKLQEYVARAFVNKGANLLELGREEEGLAACEAAIQRFQDSGRSEVQACVGIAHSNLSQRLDRAGRHDEAAAGFDRALEAYARAGSAAHFDDIIKAHAGRARALAHLGRLEEAMAAFDRATAETGRAIDRATLREIAVAMVDRAITLGESGRVGESLRCYEEVVTRFAGSIDYQIRYQVAKALFNKGVVLLDCERVDDAAQAWIALDERFGQSEDGKIRHLVALGLRNRSVVLDRASRHEEEIAIYDEIIARFGRDRSTDLQEEVALARFNRAHTLGGLGAIEEALQEYSTLEESLKKQGGPTASRLTGSSVVRRVLLHSCMREFDLAREQLDSGLADGLVTPKHFAELTASLEAIGAMERPPRGIKKFTREVKKLQSSPDDALDGQLSPRPPTGT